MIPILAAIGDASCFHDSSSVFPGFRTLDQTALEQFAQIRHARLYGRPACLATAAARRASELIADRNGRTGLLCTGGPWNCEASWTFASRALEAGPTFINPLQFPCTLESAAATIAASAIGAHGLAAVVGFDVFAFFEVMERAVQLISQHFLDCVIAIGLSGGGEIITRAAFQSGRPVPPDIAIPFLLSRSLDRPDLAVIEVSRDPRRFLEYESATQYEGIIDDAGRLSFPVALPIISREAEGATGAILALGATFHHNLLPEQQRSRDFVVGLRERRGFGMIALRLLTSNRDRFGCLLGEIPSRPLQF